MDTGNTIRTATACIRLINTHLFLCDSIPWLVVHDAYIAVFAASIILSALCHALGEARTTALKTALFCLFANLLTAAYLEIEKINRG